MRVFYNPAIYGAGTVAVVWLVLWTRNVISTSECMTMAIGGAVGVVELLGRYRHSPVRAVLTGSGFFYILVNVAASWVAFYMLTAFQVFQSVTVAKELVLILTAGLASLVVMRSSVFRVRVGDSDIGIGPSAILDTLLLVADRGVDRHEAVARAQDVAALVAHVKDPRVVAKMLMKYSLALMQNVDQKTSEDLGEAVSKIMSDAEIPDTIKMDIVALRLGIVVGPDVLQAAVEALGERLTAASGAVVAPPGPAVPPPSVANLRAEIVRDSGG